MNQPSNKEQIKIGGEFDISINLLSEYLFSPPHNNEIIYSSGRSALMVILKHLSLCAKTTVYLPYYICKATVNSCLNIGFQIEFYELNSKYDFALEFLSEIKPNAIVMIVNYFGFTNSKIIIDKIKNERPDITTISDEVLSFWTYQDSNADFSFTSVRKHLPSPDGAYVKSNIPNFINSISLKENDFFLPKMVASILKNERVIDSHFLQLFEDGEKLLDKNNKPTKGTNFSKFLLNTLNLNEIKRKRIRNAKVIYELGNQMGLNFMFDYAENITPMVVPVLVKSRNEVRNKLKNKNIFLPVHWPLEDFNNFSHQTKRICNHELSLIIDQRYSEEHMVYQMDNLKKHMV
jgi:hypothetical protein